MDQRQLNLCIDIGNSLMKVAVFRQQELLFTATGSESLSLAVAQHEISRAIISSVADNANAIRFLTEKKIPFQLLENSPLPLTIHYETKETLGADRLALAVGASLQFPGQNCLIIACGTCITYNLLLHGTSFEGGAISPGVPMRLRAMHQFTARLPQPELQNVTDVLGKSTAASLLSGAVMGTAAEIDGMCERFSSKIPDLKIIVTGGDASLLVAHLKNSIFARPALLLEGLNGILLHDA